VEYRFQRGLRFFRQVVRLGVVWELVGNDISLERQHSFRDQRGGVSIAANESCGMPEPRVDEVSESKNASSA